MEGSNHGESEVTGSSDDQQFGSASTMIMEENGKLIVITTLSEDIMPIIENKVREEIQIALQKLRPDKDWNNELAIATSVERRSLQLKFLDEVSIPVLTGEKLNGKGGAAMRLAVVDKMSGQLVVSGPEASPRVEILILQASDNEDELNWSTEDFNKRIIRGRNEGKPYFSNEMYVTLKSGIGNLCDVKLGHGSTWVKACFCRLGARVVDNVGGSMVKEAWTKSFMVRDCRIEYTKKKETPSFSDKLCRLHSIWKGGKSYRLMQREKIFTVKDLLIRLLKDHDGLKKIVNFGEKKWQDMVKHARACPSGRRMYCYTNSQRSASVVFNIHGEILRLYPKRRYTAARMPSQENKDIAGDLFSSAIGHWEDVVHFDDESSLQQHLSILGMSVDSTEPGYPVGPHSMLASETMGVRSDTSSQKECIDPPLSTGHVPIMHDWGPETMLSNAISQDFVNVDEGTEGTKDFLDPDTMLSNAISQDFLNFDTGTEVNGFMLTEPFRNWNGGKILTSDGVSTSTSSYLSAGRNTYSPDFMQPIYSMESFGSVSPATDSLFCDMDSAPPPPLWNDNIQFSEIDGTKWGWNVLISILALRFSLKRIVARKTCVKQISTSCY